MEIYLLGDSQIFFDYCQKTSSITLQHFYRPSTGFGGGIFGSGVSSGSGFKFGVTPATESSTALGFKFGDSSSSTKTNFGDSAKPSGFQFGTGSSASSTESGFRDKDSESSCKKTEDKEYPKEFLSSLKSLNSDVSL
jgi:hypothetical protein